MTIHKIVLGIGTNQQFWIPQTAAVVHVHEQDGAPCIWYFGDPSEPLAAGMFDVVGTGWDIAADRNYLGTAHCGAYVWHVLEHVD